MQFEFERNKYQKELLVDCFQRNVLADSTDAQNPFNITFFEIILITKGSGKFMLDNEVIPFKKGTVLLLPPNKWRQWFEITESFESVYLIFEEEFISKFFNDPLYLYRFHYFYNTNTPSYLTLENNELKKNLETLFEIQLEIKNLKPDSEHFLRALLYYLLIDLNRKYEEHERVNQSFYKEILILKFRKLLEANIHIKQRVSDYTTLLQVSASHLNKLMKAYFGKSTSEVIKERLTLEIKKHLLFSEKNISEISYDLGFSEPSNFNRFFQKQVQMTPKEYRLQNDKS